MKNRMRILSETSLKPFHTFGLAIDAKTIIEAHQTQDFHDIWQRFPHEPKLIVGEGSNLLFCDNYQGIVILNRLKGIEVKETEQDYLLHVAGGENWHDFVSWTIAQGMGGLENLALIPGLVGSSPIQNIGAYGVELAKYCDYVDIVLIEDWQPTRLSAAECQFGYRESIFKHQLKDKAIILSVGFRLPKHWHPVIHYAPLDQFQTQSHVTSQDIFNQVCEVRRLKLPDPKWIGNAGSFFKNPIVAKSQVEALQQRYANIPFYRHNEYEVKVAAGWLIEQAGLKGYRQGDAAVYDKQALVLTNQGQATPQDVLQLARLIVNRVFDQFGIVLTHEVRFMGATAETCLDEICQ